MNIPSLTPEPLSHGRQKKIFRSRQTIFGVLALVAISGAGWLIIMRFARNPLDKVDNFIAAKKLDKAAILNYKLLQKRPENRLALLMNGTVINFGIRELNITDTRLPFYEYDDFLAKEDRTGVFTRQSFLKKFSVFPDSPYFLDEFCHFNFSYPESMRNPETGVIVARSIHSKTVWNKVSQDCIDQLFHQSENLQAFFGRVSGENLSMRDNPGTGAKLLARLKKDEKVLVKYQGDEETIGNKTGRWCFVVNDRQIYGWVFGAYLEMPGK